MQFTNLLVVAFAAMAAAVPSSSKSARSVARSAGRTARIEARQNPDLCSGITSPLCCQIDVLGLVDLTCESPPGSPQNVTAFEDSCAVTGLTAECCTLDATLLALICRAPAS